MSSDLLPTLLSNIWSVFLVVLFFGGSIFVHELGHFLAARRRGVLVERFSIGFGPAIWSRRGKDGVEYRLSWFPLGGYVLLPQLADLGPIEGESTADLSRLAPVSYGTKMLVFVAGAAFNILFAFVLATIVWAMGTTVSSDEVTTRVGYVASTIELPDGSKVPGPAAEAGVQAGDVIIAIDGDKVRDWSDVMHSLVLGSGRSAKGERQVILDLERNGQRLQKLVRPVLAGDEKFRRIGIIAAYELVAYKVAPGSIAEQAGFKPDDEILRVESTPIISNITFRELLESAQDRPVPVTVRRNGQEVIVMVPPGPKASANLGLELGRNTRVVHVPPVKQIRDVVRWTVRTLQSLVNPHSDVTPRHMSGPVGIANILHTAATIGIGAVFTITILLNVNLAIFNLLPLPVLDGGQMVFATIARLRGRALPVNVIAAAQSLFLVMLLCMVAYVTFFSDVPRIARDRARAAEQRQSPAATQPAK